MNKSNSSLFFLLFVFFLSINLFAHEDGGEKDIRCSVTYGTEQEMDIYRINKIKEERLFTP